MTKTVNCNKDSNDLISAHFFPRANAMANIVK